MEPRRKIGVMPLKVKELRIASNNQKLGRGKEGSSSRVFRESTAQLRPRFWTSSLQNYDRINFYYIKATQFVLICYK